MRKNKIVKELYKLFRTFFKESYTNTNIYIKCFYLFSEYDSPTSEVTTYRYKFHIVIDDKVYVYHGWCYKEDLSKIALGIYSHWLLSNYKIYDGLSTAWYDLYVCKGSIVEKDYKD